MVTDSGDISAVSLPDVWAARSALSGIIRRTPLLREDRLNEILGCDVRLKAEQLQRTGSFKFRGLYHRVRNLDDEEREAGIITVSAGNAALASAMSARLLDIDCTVVMPEQAVETKFRAVERLGATVVRHGRNALEMFQKADELVASRGYAVVHPFGQPEVIAGHGTLGLELLEEVPDVDYVLAPASGGGLISGLCVAIKNLNPRIGVIGIQPEGSDGLRRSFLERTIVACETVDTLADGLTAPGPAPINLDIIQSYADDILLVSDDEILKAMVLVWETLRTVVEPAGATALAALLRYERFRGKRCVIVLTGANADLGLVRHAVEGGSAEAWKEAR